MCFVAEEDERRLNDFSDSTHEEGNLSGLRQLAQSDELESRSISGVFYGLDQTKGRRRKLAHLGREVDVVELRHWNYRYDWSIQSS